MALSQSLFVPRAGADGSSGALEAAIGWMTGTLLGSVATILCVIAIAFVGFQMMAGRYPVRRGVQVVLGCFLLLGAPVVATALSNAWREASGSPPQPMPLPRAEDPRGDLPPANADPYAGASVRGD